MIPNGKQMDWNGHNLTFESEHDRCSGCFFANKNECPDCDEGIWVEDNPSPWHTGTPTEEGWYLCKMRGADIYETNYFTGMNWEAHIIEKWQKIEEERE